MNMPINKKIKLKSWKGDYLHLPEFDDITTYKVGAENEMLEGNEWIVEVLGNNKIKLKSWLGDYLHRPDTPQGVIVWQDVQGDDDESKYGNEWTVEVVGNNKIKLKSWKGDYLHRPDTDKGVTTGTGTEWTIEFVNSQAKIDIPSATSQPYVLQFDGVDDYVEIPHSDALDLTDNYTLEAWVKADSLGGRILDKGIGGMQEGFTFDTCGGLRFINQGVFLASAQLQPDKWQHVAVVFANKTDGAKLFINGEQVAVQTPTGLGTSQKTLPIRISSQADATGSLFAGQVAEVRIWQGARSQAEIQQYMQTHLTGKEAGLIGYWPLNEGSGTTARDQTANGNHGNIHSATWRQAQLSLQIASNLQSETATAQTPSSLSLSATSPTETPIFVTTELPLPTLQSLNRANLTTKEDPSKPMSDSNVTSTNTEEQTQLPTSEKVEVIKEHLFATGLEDYGFWWEEMLKEQQALAKLEKKPFRRGRIWA